tara:strand:+ start:303 stop:1340 length:1038 start_codon:yes stop_codon:yes gene_type:complete
MAGESIDEGISDLLTSAKAYQSSEPIYSLLLCRKATEAFLMKKHLQMVKDGEAKEVLTLGDAYSNRLGLKEILSPLELMSIQYIQNATNPFLHFRVSKLELREDLIPRVLQEVESITNVDLDGSLKSNNSFEPEIEKTSTSPSKEDWRVVLRREIDEYDWPQDLKNTFFCESVLSRLIKGRSDSIESNTSNLIDIVSLKEGIPKLKVAQLRSELESRNLNHLGQKAKLVERLIPAYEREIDIINNRLKKSIETKRIYQDILNLGDNEKLGLLKESTEAGLIALYNATGEKWNQNQLLGKRKRKVFFEAVREILPFNIRPKNVERYWKFLFIKGKLSSKWEFFDIR